MTAEDLRASIANRIGDVPSIHYVPEFVTREEEQAIIDNIRACKTGWRVVKDRRVQNFGGTVERGVLLQVPFPRWLGSIVERLFKETGVYGTDRPNHVLLNGYSPGQGIFNHQDGPIYHPAVCILSLGSTAVMNFRRRLPEGGYEEQPGTQVMLQPRSLLIFSQDAYEQYLHGIDEVTEDVMHDGIANLEMTGLQAGDRIVRQGERLSLTVRRVLRTRKILFKT